MVLTVKERPQDAEAALEQLCRTYWGPLALFVRARGYSPEQAEDLTQEFFASLLRRDFLRNVQPAHGKFRSFLLASLKNFLSSERDKQQAIKRGGEFTFVPLDGDPAREIPPVDPPDDRSPDKLFDRQWAMTLLDQALTRLRGHYQSSGQEKLFEELKPLLTGDQPDSYKEIAERLRTTEGALKQQVLRMRERYRGIVRDLVADTVSTEADLEEELRYLKELLVHTASSCSSLAAGRT